MAGKKSPLIIAVARCDKKATEAMIPEGVVAIQYYAFGGCESLSSVTIPKSVTIIGDRAFSDCKSLVSITIPKTMRVIGINVFKGCTSLAEIRFEGTMAQWEKVKKDVLSFGRHSGDNCINYITCTDENVPLPHYSIENGILEWWCIGDTNAIIPVGVMEIKEHAFQDCTSLTSITIPKSVKEIGDNAFYCCTSLSEIHFDGTMEQWDEVEKNEGWFASSALTCVKCTNGVVPIPHYVIKKGILRWRYQDDTEAIIPDGVTKIGDVAFLDFTSLASITIPETVKEIGDGSFKGCRSLASVTIPENVTKIGVSAFDSCKSLASITIPSSVKKICIGAFSNCKSLVSVTILKGVKKIDHFAFCNCKSLTSIAIPEGLNKIGGSVFQDCTSLASLTIPESIKELGGLVFDGCISLSEIRFGGTMEQWEAVKKQDTWKGSEMFGGCIPAKVVHCTNGDIPL